MGLALLIALGTVWLVNAGLAVPTSLPEKYALAVDKAAAFLDGPGDAADQLLKEIGYDHPGISDDDWRVFPPVYKFVTAYKSAEAAVPGSGEQVLALLSKTLAQQWEAPRGDPAIRYFAAMANEKSIKQIKFAPIQREAKDAPPELTAKAKGVLYALAHFCDGGSFGPHSVLVNYFGLEPEKAGEILISSRSTEEILHRGILSAPESDREMGMRRLVADMDYNYESARAIKEFDHWRPKKEKLAAFMPWNPPDEPFRWTPSDGSPPWKPSDGPKPPRGGGGWTRDKNPKDPFNPRVSSENIERTSLPVRELWRKEQGSIYRSFMKREYKLPQMRRYGRARSSAGGFGGVVLGSEVTGPDLPSGSKLDWEPSEKKQERGKLWCILDDKKVALDGVLQEDVRAAYELVYGGPEADAADHFSEGDIIGLVGIKDQAKYFDCGPDRLLHEGRRWNVVMHPALVNSSLGWSVLMADVIPLDEMRPSFLAQMKESAGEETAVRVARVLNLAQTTWKFSDVPMRISIEGERLSVQRNPYPADKWPVELRSSAFFTFNAFNAGGKFVEESGDLFYPLVPAIVKVASAYQRLNEFSRVMAVVRWAKAKGAKFPEPPSEAPANPRAASVIVTRDGVVAAPRFEPEEAQREQREKVRLRMINLELRFPVLRTLRQELPRLEKEKSAHERKVEAIVAQIKQISTKLDNEYNIANYLKRASKEVQEKYAELMRRQKEILYALYDTEDGSREREQTLAKLRQCQQERRKLLAEESQRLEKERDQETKIIRDCSSKLRNPASLVPKTKRVPVQLDYWLKLRSLQLQIGPDS